MANVGSSDPLYSGVITRIGEAMLSLSVLSKHLSNSNGLGSEELESVTMLACFRGYFYPAPAGFPGGF